MQKEEYQAAAERYSTMVYRYCGHSGLQLPVISLGLWQNFGSVDVYENYSRIAFTAFDRGITHFDLANNYGPVYGSAEENFGRILKSGLGKYRDELVISTKAGYDMWPGPYGVGGSRKYLMASLNQSLKRMGIDYVDIFYSHRLDPDTPLEETMSALADIVRQGKALYAGISNYDAKQTEKAVELLQKNGTPCLIHQSRYSMLERKVEPELLPLLKEKGIGMIAFSPLAQGRLTEKYFHGIPENSRAAKSTGRLTPEMITPDLLEKVKALNVIAQQRGQTLPQMALSWLLKNPGVSSVLIGASSVAQLTENLQILGQPGFEDEELQKIEAILKR